MELKEKRETLSAILVLNDPTQDLWNLVDSGLSEEIVPELVALRLEQDPIHRHKDVLAHTIAVTAKTRADLILRLAALFHDIGKPATRKYTNDAVTFYHHEAVGAKITKKRLKLLEYPPEVVKDVSELVRLSGQFKGYTNGWSDAAVRRYARRAGHLLDTLNELVRSDCTTRNPETFQNLQDAVTELEERLQKLAKEDAMAKERPLMDGDEVMKFLGLPAGREVGKALKFLLELKRAEPELDLATTKDRLEEWWAKNQPK